MPKNARDEYLEGSECGKDIRSEVHLRIEGYDQDKFDAIAESKR